MTAEMTRELADGALDALALIEASVESNPTNRASVLKHADPVLLISGLVVVASMLREGLAKASGVSPGEIDMLVRHRLIAVGDEAA